MATRARRKVHTSQGSRRAPKRGKFVCGAGPGDCKARAVVETVNVTTEADVPLGVAELGVKEHVA